MDSPTCRLSKSRGDAAVRKHFDSNTELYLDKYEEFYRPAESRCYSCKRC